MAKIKVHELAKELNVSSKDVLEVLRKGNVEVSNHMSAVPEEALDMVRKNFKQAAPAKNTEAKSAEAPKAAEAAAENHADSAEAKKKRPAFVFRPQNSAEKNFGGKNGNGGKHGNGGNNNRGNFAGKAPARPAKEETKAAPVKEAPKAAEPAKAAPAAKPAEPAKAPERRVITAAEAIAAARLAREQREKEAEIKRAEAEKAAEEFRQAEAKRQEEAAKAAEQRAAVRKEQQRNNNNGQNRGNGNFQRRDGGNGNGNFQRRDGGNGGQNRGNGNFQRRDGGNGNGSFQRRDGGNGNGNFQRRDGGNGNGNFQRRDGGNGNGGFQNRGNGGQNRGNGNGSFQNRGNGAARGGESLTPINSKNTDSRGSKIANKKRDKDKQMFENGSRHQENTRNLGKTKPVKKPETPAPVKKEEDEIRTLILPDVLTLKELADKMKVQPATIVKQMFLKGEMMTINSELTFDKAEEIAMEYNCICEHEVKVDVIAELLKDTEDPEDTLVTRPPVVCVMGHVDHGKTSLLDAIRQTHVTDREAGGITQHIGAYVVTCNGQKITFLDTPGHEAFTAMRMRGAQSTDIAILVVAADDGVMPQTIEAISHAKAAGVEIIVAINKIDKPGANIDNVKKELSEQGLIPEDWGGSTICVPVSAHTKEGIDTLLEMVLLTAEVKELKANPNRLARGIVIEAELDKGRGPVATVLIQKGTLHVGDTIAAGSCHGKVRAMIDDNGRRVKEATPSTPVEILGLNDVPGAGEIFVQTANDKEARSFAETFIKEGRERMLEETKSKLTLDGLFSQIQAGNVKELNLIVKADVQGSVEAVKQSLTKLSNEEVVVKVIHGGVGAINESDVSLASASNAIIIGFNVRPDVTAKVIADRENVDVRLYRVIYQAIEDVEAAMKGMLDPVYEEKVIGHAVVRQIFKASGVGNIAGSYVTDGMFQRGCSVRITREGEQIYEGLLASLKRFKDDVKEVKEGYECGLVFDKFNDIKEEDVVEAYTMVEVPR